VDQVGLDRQGNLDIQMDLFLSYGTNVPLYPEFQAFFRKYQPPTLIVWGKNDFIFPAEGAAPYARDLKNLETHMLDTGHFALETHGEEIGNRIEGFLLKNLKRSPRAAGGAPRGCNDAWIFGHRSRDEQESATLYN
jgi:pimeloyl-ACP methyl ester carboxylesterase